MKVSQMNDHGLSLFVQEMAILHETAVSEEI